MPPWLENLINSPYVIGGAVTAAVLLIIFALTRRQPRVVRAFNAEGGQVLVTRRAVRDLVQRCCEELGDVASAHATVAIKNGKLRTRVELRLRHNANLKGVTGYLREQVTQALTENLGLEELGEVDVIVIGVLEKPATE